MTSTDDEWPVIPAGPFPGELPLPFDGEAGDDEPELPPEVAGELLDRGDG